jgi:hypothetical protein
MHATASAPPTAHAGRRAPRAPPTSTSSPPSASVSSAHRHAMAARGRRSETVTRAPLAQRGSLDARSRRIRRCMRSPRRLGHLRARPRRPPAAMASGASPPRVAMTPTLKPATDVQATAPSNAAGSAPKTRMARARVSKSAATASSTSNTMRSATTLPPAATRLRASLRLARNAAVAATAARIPVSSKTRPPPARVALATAPTARATRLKSCATATTRHPRPQSRTRQHAPSSSASKRASWKVAPHALPTHTSPNSTTSTWPTVSCARLPAARAIV